MSVFLRRLLPTSRKIDPSTDSHFAIRAATLNGHINVVRLLLSSPLVDHDEAGQHALLSACSAGLEDMVRILVEELKVSPSVGAVCAAAENGRVGVLRIVVGCGRVDLEAVAERTCHIGKARYEGDITVHGSQQGRTHKLPLTFLRRTFRIPSKPKEDETHHEKELETEIADEMPPVPYYTYQKEAAGKSEDGSLNLQMPEGGKWRSPEFLKDAYLPERDVESERDLVAHEKDVK
ncbi:hypothetical protein HDU67_003068 [Dinochytrium kinnereticum]|nr:hypothetical protein HDU67_003068 [Dinochytrium kinnereticum]